MRLIFVVLLVFHGFIHLIGFVKAFDLYDIGSLQQSVSKPTGLFWLFSFVLFSIATYLFIAKHNYWWLPALLAAALSQILIVWCWQDTKFGSILNVVIAIVSVVSIGSFSFKKSINKELIEAYKNVKELPKKVMSNEEFARFPKPVKDWISTSGILDRASIFNVFLNQKILMKMKPDQGEWFSARASQFFSINPPAFNWSVDVSMNAMLKLKGRDKYENGKGEMLIKLASLFPVVDVNNNEKTDQATLQRYLGEIIWFPSAAFSLYIEWVGINANSAKAIMNYKGVMGEGIFSFNDAGDPIRFSAMRYMGEKADAEMKNWRIDIIEMAERNGVRIPIHVKASWELETGDWTWLDLRIEEIKYNLTSPPKIK